MVLDSEWVVHRCKPVGGTEQWAATDTGGAGVGISGATEREWSDADDEPAEGAATTDD